MYFRQPVFPKQKLWSYPTSPGTVGIISPKFFMVRKSQGVLSTSAITPVREIKNKFRYMTEISNDIFS